MSALLELATRCEAAEAIDQRELIKEAGRLVFGKASVHYARLCDLVNVGAFLDAAMTLVPEGMDFAVGHGIETELGGSPTDYAWCGEGGGDLIFAATAALALCAAALRARATMETVK